MEEHQLDQSTACAASAVMLDKQRSVEVLRRWGSNSTFGSCIHLFAEELSLFKKGFCFFLFHWIFKYHFDFTHTHSQKWSWTQCRHVALPWVIRTTSSTHTHSHSPRGHAQLCWHASNQYIIFNASFCKLKVIVRARGRRSPLFHLRPNRCKSPQSTYFVLRQTNMDFTCTNRVPTLDVYSLWVWREDWQILHSRDCTDLDLLHGRVFKKHI